MILLLRGHIRQSFENRNLYNLIKELHKIHPISIYIHTWSKYSNNLSWRTVEEDNRPVTDDIIYEYFEDLSIRIRKIIIDDDQTIPIIGKTEGNMAPSKMPLKGWKNYWYGQFMIMKEIYEKEHDTSNQKVLNTRFDVLTNSIPFSIEQVRLFFIYNLFKKFDKNVFIIQEAGVDNVIFGTIHTMYKLLLTMHTELDNIMIRFKGFGYHEQLVSLVNEAIFKKDMKRMTFH